jgi:uncharacterized integral membrane protein (TIGR00697 family)
MVVTAVPAMLLYRLISIGYLTLPGGMFIFPMIYIMTDVIAEVYGYQVARLFIWASLINNFLIAILIMTVIYLPFPNDLKIISHEYVDVYHGLLRADIANIAGVLISCFVNAYVIAKWKILVRGKWFIIRSFSSRIAYKLNLNGPAISINTACSTSLTWVLEARNTDLTK